MGGSQHPSVHIRLLGKPATYCERRMELELATVESIAEARDKALKVAYLLESRILYQPSLHG